MKRLMLSLSVAALAGAAFSAEPAARIVRDLV